jgi:antitoxin YefM
MSIEISYSEARNNLASLLDRVTDDREIVVINRRGHEKVALISADELSSIMETIHLISSPRNAMRLLSALEEAEKGGGQASTVEELRKEFNVEKPKRRSRSHIHKQVSR